MYLETNILYVMKQIIVEWTVLWNVQQISGVGEQYKYKTYNTMIKANKYSRLLHRTYN